MAEASPRRTMRKRKRPSSTLGCTTTTLALLAWYMVSSCCSHGVALVTTAFTPVLKKRTSNQHKNQQQQQHCPTQDVVRKKGGPLTVCETTERKKKHVRWDEWKNCRIRSSDHEDEEAEGTRTLPADGDYYDSLPPWLSRYYDEASNNATSSLHWLQYTLLEQEQWTLSDVRHVQQTMYTLASQHGRTPDRVTLLGMVDFVKVLLENTMSEDVNERRGRGPFVTKEILLAAVWHYAESIAARKEGVLDTNFLRQNILLGASSTMITSPSSSSTSTTTATTKMIPILRTTATGDASEWVLPFQARPSAATPLRITAATGGGTTVALEEENREEAGGKIVKYSGSIDNSNNEVWKIARGAAQIKRAEVLARAVEEVNSNGPTKKNEKSSSVLGSSSNNKSIASLSAEEASRIRGLLLTVDGFDWRSLMLRCVACLYRLEGILESDRRVEEGPIRRSPEVIRTAREGLRVFATLAQQLGLSKLKNRIEDRAFRILYQRQYRAVTALYETNSSPDGSSKGKIQSEPMESVSAFLQSHIASTLFEDEDLMQQLDDLSVQSRVKERFSFWKKLVKKRFQMIAQSSPPTEKGTILEVDLIAGERDESLTASPVAETAEENGSLPSSSLFSLAASSSLSSPSPLVSDYAPDDVVALRVILKARQWYKDEPEDRIRERERLLCYYVQQKLRSLWPATDPARVKDYIKFPKPNGYQSLHYTSIVSDESGLQFPFEVQVRSDEMHKIAEHGVASHWGYKLGNQSAPTSRSVSDFSTRGRLLPPSPSTDAAKRTTASSHTAPDLPSSSLSTGNSYLDSLALVREDMAAQQVYVFVTVATSNTSGKSRASGGRSAEEIGKLVALPVNSRVKEAVVTLLKEYSANGFDPLKEAAGTAAPNVFRNGHPARLSDVVETGDVLLVSL